MTELLSKRRVLINCLLNAVVDDLDGRPVNGALNDWFQAYKSWEASDRFTNACREGRMVIRQSVEAGFVPDGVVNGLGMRGKHEAVTTDATMYNDYRSNVGIAGITARMNPDSFTRLNQPLAFGDKQEWRGKYVLGLHDLSASLFNPSKRTISEQCRWKDDGKGSGKFADWYLVFIPLAPAGEVRLFNLMKKLAATELSGDSSFATNLARISKRMTRITYAQETDMGAGFVSIGHKSEDAARLPRFRYGAGGVQSEMVDKKLKVRAAPGAAVRRQRKALDYKALLALQDARRSTSNEVILKARQHEGDRFPIFAKWDAQAKGFVCKPDEKSSSYIAGGVLSDVWSSVRQL